MCSKSVLGMKGGRGGEEGRDVRGGEGKGRGERMGEGKGRWEGRKMSISHLHLDLTLKG